MAHGYKCKCQICEDFPIAQIEFDKAIEAVGTASNTKANAQESLQKQQIIVDALREQLKTERAKWRSINERAIDAARKLETAQAHLARLNQTKAEYYAANGL